MSYDPLAPDETNLGDDEVFEHEVGEDDGGKYVLPDGTYTALCTGVEKGRNKADTNDQYTWSFLVKGANGKEIEVKDWTGLTPQMAWKLRQVVAALGVPVVGTQVKFTRKQVVGKRCQVELKKEEYNGRYSSKIKKIGPHPGGADAPLGETL